MYVPSYPMICGLVINIKYMFCCYGCFFPLQADTQQFITAFKAMSQPAEQEIIHKGFRVTPVGQRATTFKVYSKTYSR
jgi:hypothetical protein